MNEAPKKIWLNPQEECWGVKQWTPFDTPYIRADIVDELVKALNTANDLMKLNIAVQEHIQSVLDAMKEEK